MARVYDIWIKLELKTFRNEPIVVNDPTKSDVAIVEW